MRFLYLVALLCSWVGRLGLDRRDRPRRLGGAAALAGQRLQPAQGLADAPRARQLIGAARLRVLFILLPRR